ncbi:MAG: ceramide glucosyltransferase [Candidatus Sulfobium sp.]
MTFFWICAVIALIGLVGYLFQSLSVRFYTAPRLTEEEGRYRSLPPVSILKPLKGLDDGLFDNLESFCNLDYPAYEIIFALQNRNDPAGRVAERIKEKYPSKDISVVVEFCDDGLNPKVNNLIPAYKRAKYDLLLISDSNVRVEKDYLAAVAGHMTDPSVGLVSNMIKGVNGRSLGAVLENLHLNSFIVGSVCFLDKYLGLPCVIGKSMLMKRSDLEAIGGFAAVKDLLAEDYIIGQRIHKLGKKVVLSNHIVGNVNEYWEFRKFFNRHTRWGKLRWHIGGIKYFLELIGNAVFISCLPLVFSPLRVSLPLAALVSSLKIICDYYIGRKLGARMNPLLYLLAPVKDIFIGCIWFVPVFSNRVVWRDNTYLIGKDSQLFPCPAAGKRHWRPAIIAAIRSKLALSRS